MRHITLGPILLIAALLFTLTLISTVSAAESIMLENDNNIEKSFYYVPGGYGSTDISSTAYKIQVYRIQEWVGLETVYFKSTSVTGGSSSPSGSTPVTICIDGTSTVIGTGTAYYNKLYSSSGAVIGAQFWIDFDSFNPGANTGTKTLSISGTSVFGGIKYAVNSGSIYVLNDNYPLILGAGSHKAIGTYILRASAHWENSLDYTDSVISISRDGYYSSVLITSNGLTLLSDSSTYDVSTPYVSSANYTITDVFGTAHTGTIGISDSPVSPTVDFSVTLSPTSAAIGDPVQATLSPAADAPPYDMVEWTIADDWRPYRLVTGTWCAYNATTETYADAVTEADVLSQTCQFTQEGNGPVFCRVYDLANGTLLADLKEYVTVSGTSSLKFPLYVAVFDADTGATLMSTTCQITNLDTSEVSTTTIQTSRAGETFLLDSSDRYQIIVSKAGYESRTWSNIRSDTSSLTAYLPKIAVPGDESQVSLYFRVHNTAGSPVAGAYVQLAPGGISGLTNNQGQAVLTVSKNTTYTYQVSASGYVGATDSLEVSATSLWYECTLIAEGETVSGEPTPESMSTADIIDTGVNTVLDWFVPLIAFACLATFCGLLELIGGRRR